MNADGSQPEFDFDDIAVPASKPASAASETPTTVAVEVREPAPSPAVTPAPVIADETSDVKASTSERVAEVVVAAPAVAESAVTEPVIAAPAVTEPAAARDVEAAVDTSARVAEVAIEQAPQVLAVAEAEPEAPMADAAENVSPEPVVETVPEPVATQVVESEPAKVDDNAAMDASRRAEELRGLFNTARASSDITDAPLAANADGEAPTEAEEATRNA